MIRILYLEDNMFDIDLTQLEIKKSIPDSTVVIAKTIKEANKHLADNPDFQVAILDLNLPDGNGIDMLIEIRRQKLPIAVIILTGSGNEESATAALKAGADDYLTKTEGYLKKLPDIIVLAIKNFRKNLEKSFKPLNVLYVEWNKPDIEFTLRHFQKYAPHFQLVNISTANEALNLLPKNDTENCSFDLLLMDYRLPGLNAIEVIKIIRQERKLRIPIVLVTGHGNETVAVQALKLGANEYLVKRENYLFRLPSLLTSAHQRYELEKQQITLGESESKYRLLADNSSDVIFILDLDLNYKYVSPSVKQLRGYEVEEVLKQNLSEVLTPESFNNAIQLISSVSPLLNEEHYKEIEPRIIELEMVKKDGSTVWTELKVAVLADENNVPIGFQGAARDISKRKEALDDLRKKSQAIDQSPVSVIITNTAGNIEYVNPFFTKVSGYSINEVYGKNPRILKGDISPSEMYTDLWKKITTGNIWTGELQNKKKDGTLYWESASISPIVNKAGNITHYVAVKEDITSKKKYEQELIIARDQALESNRLKSAFLATMSHELRTPLNAIIGFSDLINEELSKADILKFAKTINTSGNHLLSIIEDIFTISLLQTKQSKVVLQEFKLSTFYEELIQYTITEQQTKKKLNLNLLFDDSLYHSKCVISTDKTKLFQVLINFIKNALKYTDQGEIEIGQSINNEDITFYVKDTGIGIPADQMEVIFEHFRQLDDSNTRIHDGVGLGLAICSEIQQLLKGKIHVESELGSGSTFFFTLNNVIQKNGNSKKELVPTKTPNLIGKIILVVEDEEINYQLLKTYIKKTNATVIWAKSGEESVEICNTNSDMDLVLMDIRMPGIDGFEATRQIKKRNNKLTIIAQTAYALANDRQKALNAGCDDYISKPIKLSVLFDLFSKYIV